MVRIDTAAEYEYLELGRFALCSGYSLPDARLAYRTHGTLDAERANAVLVPHGFAATPSSLDDHIGPGRPLDTDRYFVICPGQLGAGLSSSPSTMPPPYDRGQFPPLAITDDVRAQHRLVTEHLRIESLHAVLGWSTGGQQAYEWAARFGDMVPRAAAFAAGARTPVHTQIAIDTVLELLRSDPAFAGGFYRDPADVRTGLARLAVVFSLTGFTSEWYRFEEWRALGYASADDFRQGFVRGRFSGMDPNDLVSQATKWRAFDITPHGNGSLYAALGRIRTHFFVVPFSGDGLVPVDDQADEAGHLPLGELRVVDTPAGHFAMTGLREQDRERIGEIITEMLTS